jgi:hypothetical protein
MAAGKQGIERSKPGQIVLTPGGPPPGARFDPPNRPRQLTASPIVYGFTGVLFILFAARYNGPAFTDAFQGCKKVCVRGFKIAPCLLERRRVCFFEKPMFLFVVLFGFVRMGIEGFSIVFQRLVYCNPFR